MNKNKLKKGASLIGGVLGLYALYVLVGAVVVPVMSTPPEAIDEPSEFIDTNERVTLLEYGMEAYGARIDSIQEAEETIDVAYYYMEEGESSEAFYAYILDAANRGVNVRYMLDGVSHGLRGENRNMLRLFIAHPNIEIKLYEPVSHFILAPWRLNNRLHDKLLIIDESYAIIGGRNVGDLYFQSDEIMNPYSYDRDLLLINEENEEGLISQMKTYYNELWESEYAKSQERPLLPWEERRVEETTRSLETIYTNHREEMKTREYTSSLDQWINQSVPIERGFFTHNSLERNFKEPRVWSDMLSLMEQAEESAYVQSPWVIPDRQMRQDIEARSISVDEGILLTNSMATDSNFIAQSGTENRKQDFIDSDFYYYEYQPINSSLHMKSLVIDETISAVGAFNFDARSAYLSTESMVVIESEELADEILNEIETTYLPKSVLFEANGNNVSGSETEIETPKWWERIGIQAFRPIIRLVESIM